MDSRLKRFCEVAEKLYPPFEPEDGISLNEVEGAEKRYGFRLPSVLRDYYRVTGGHESINYSSNRLISVDCLEIEDRKLIFYQENQGAYEWAIDLSDISDNDPPIWQGVYIEGQETNDWYLETKHLSTFLVSALCWQSVMGGLPFGALKEKVGKEVIKKIADNFEVIDLSDDYSEMKAFIGKGKVFCVFERDDNFNLYIGATNKEDLIEIDELLQIKWDYNSLTDK